MIILEPATKSACLWIHIFSHIKHFFTELYFLKYRKYNLSRAKLCVMYRSRERLLMHKMDKIYDNLSLVNHALERKSETCETVAGWKKLKEEQLLFDSKMNEMNKLIQTRSTRGVSLDEIPEIEGAINDVLVQSELL